jgi:hypothetical protein
MTHRDLRDWLVRFVAELLDIAPSEVDASATWETLGVDSATILVLVAELSAGPGWRVRPIDVLEHPTISSLAAHLTVTAPAGV